MLPVTRVLTLLLVAVGLLTGCASKTPRPVAAAGHAAFVEVSSRSAQEVSLITTAVFRDAGYTPMHASGSELAFERKGSTWNTILHGDWSDGKIWYRARIYIQSYDAGKYLVSGDLFRVIDKGDAHFEEERKASGRGELQELLKQVKARALVVP